MTETQIVNPKLLDPKLQWPNVGAEIIRIGVLGVPYCDYSIIYPQPLITYILIIKAPILITHEASCGSGLVRRLLLNEPEALLETSETACFPTELPLFPAFSHKGFWVQVVVFGCLRTLVPTPRVLHAEEQLQGKKRLPSEKPQGRRKRMQLPSSGFLGIF